MTDASKKTLIGQLESLDDGNQDFVGEAIAVKSALAKADSVSLKNVMNAFIFYLGMDYILLQNKTM